MDNNTIERVIKLIKPMSRGKVDIQPDTMIIEDKVIDSLSVINLIMEIEREFDMRMGVMDVTIDDFQSPIKIQEAIDRLKK
ncbi:hypothetical protein N9W89_10655 [Hellea sp.]|nr:hypothetical protein [Hellea sp.]